MKNKTAVILMALGLTLPATTFGQKAEPAPQPAVKRPIQRKMSGSVEAQPAIPATGTVIAATPASQPRRSGSALIAAIDVNQDGILDAAEIAKASESLLKLDKNSDGTLTGEELHPQRLNRSRAMPAAGAETGSAETTNRPSGSRLGALDANHDGAIDAAEISGASQVLAKFDKDGDGKVTREELRSRPSGTSRTPRSAARASKE